MSFTTNWPRAARVAATLLAWLLPADVCTRVLGDIDDAYRQRQSRDAVAANRWLRRQLALTLRPRRLGELRRTSAVALGADDDAGLPTRLARAVAAFGADLRYAVRTLRTSPGFSALTVVVLTGGLAVSIFTFSFMNTVLHKPLPLPAGDRVVRIMGVSDSGRSGMLDADAVQFLRRNLTSFEQLGSYVTDEVVIRGAGDDPRALRATLAEPVMFDAASASPMLGRRLAAADAEPGAEPVAVLSHRAWVNEFGSDSDIVDRVFELNGVATRIVGVMPEGYGFPVFGLLWMPFDPEAPGAADDLLWLNFYGVLGEGVTIDRATVELDAATERYRATLVEPDRLERAPVSARAVTFQKMQLGDEADLVFGLVHLAAGFILLLACVNAGNLMLARSLERNREISIRVAIGASRGRLVTQMMAEGVLLTAVAGAVATFAAARSLDLFDAGARAALPTGLAFWWRWGFDTPTLLAAITLIAGTMLIVGGVPAWRVSRADTNAALRDGPQGALDMESGRLSRALVVLQISAISVLLFMGGMTGLVARQAAQIDLGVNTDRLLVGQIDLDEQRYPDAESRVAVLERLRQGLADSALIEGVIVRASVGGRDSLLAIEGVRYEDSAAQPTAQVRTHLGDPEMLGQSILAGRGFDERDTAAGPPAAMVSRSLALDLFGGESPIGKQVRIGSVEEDNERPWRTVVGVMSDVVEGNPLSRARNSRTLYVPMRQLSPGAAGLTFRHNGDLRAAVTAFYDVLERVDPELHPNRVIDFDEMFGQMEAMARAATQVLGGCFGFALLLAIGGIYALASRSVTRRTQEIGIRRALGATNARIVSLFLRGSGRQLALGLGLATVVSGVASALVLSFAEIDAGLFIAGGVLVPILISSLVLLATWVPARRAVRLDPRVAIYEE